MIARERINLTCLDSSETDCCLNRTALFILTGLHMTVAAMSLVTTAEQKAKLPHDLHKGVCPRAVLGFLKANSWLNFLTSLFATLCD